MYELHNTWDTPCIDVWAIQNMRYTMHEICMSYTTHEIHHAWNMYEIHNTWDTPCMKYVWAIQHMRYTMHEICMSYTTHEIHHAWNMYELHTRYKHFTQEQTCCKMSTQATQFVVVQVEEEGSMPFLHKFSDPVKQILYFLESKHTF